MAAKDQDYLGVSPDWQNAGNWSTGVPVANDNVRLTDSSQALTTNLNQSAITPPYDLLHLSETMTGNLGGTGNPLIVDADTVTCRSGAQESWFRGTYPQFIAAPRLLTANACVIDTVAPELLTNLYVQRGLVTLLDSSVITNGFMLAEGSSAKLIVQANTVFSGDLHINAGRVILDGEVDGTVFLNGGVLEMTENADVNDLVQTGGTCEFDDGDFTGSVIIHAGHFNGSRHGKFTLIPDMKILSNVAHVNLRTQVGAIDITTFLQIGTAKVILDDGKTY